ncbi:hypothetical protein H9Q72_007246 [Fusarium xylarioides]|uniref:Cytochrome P450 n=1 Tax=Fusarium xylarioides TaxID=221167 RepID=A0A9P7L569_9HYPO|nr:hypothetical protein H9Q72_007246 [Fusarium xylarioides]
MHVKELVISGWESLRDGSLMLQLAVASAVCAAFLLLWLRQVKFGSMRKIPGPWYLKLTTLFVKYHELNGSQSLWVHRLHLRYGPVVQIASNEISFASYTSSKQIYSNGNKDFRKTELYHGFVLLALVLVTKWNAKIWPYSNLFTALDPEKHSEIRRQLADRYSNSTVLKSKIMEAIAERAQTFVDVCTQTNSADLYLLLHAYALDCVTAMVFYPLGTSSLAGEKDREMVRLLSYSNSRYSFFLNHYSPFLNKIFALFAPASLNSEKGGTMIRDYVYSQLTQGGQADFTLAARLHSLHNFPIDLAVSECLDHIGAGIETTGDTLCWLFWALSQPEHQDRVAKLHDELVNASPDQGLESLPYLGAVVQEALRLWAPGTIVLPRYVPDEGRHIDGYFIPGHTIVGCTSYSMHRIDKSVWPDADDFAPERWLDADGNTDRQRNFFAFGLGARTCIGKHLAMAEMRVVLNAVYTKYRTKPAHDMTASMEMDDQVLTSRPKGMRCKVEFVPWDKAHRFSSI